MKAVILAGGLGTRLSEETDKHPKPLVYVGDRPILWHIMKIYHQYGICDFIICLGYKGYLIKEYFANYALHTSDVTFDLASGEMIFHARRAEDWRVTLVDTGQDTMTGGRLKRVGHLLDEDAFCLTYGDGIGDIDIAESIRHHRASGLLATLTAVIPPGRFGALQMQNSVVHGFQEKPAGDGGWINAGFFVLSPRVLDLIDGDNTSWEGAPLERLARDGQLGAYKHRGFWRPMDTLRDKIQLEEMWNTGRAPWRIWE